MSICLRICSAYTCRFTRRHSTLLLITSFIVTITVILHVYSYRHQNLPYLQPRVGDFDYHPGHFLTGHQPNENISYCDFNYGLPETLKWATLRVYGSPEIGIWSPYKVIYNAVRGRAYLNHSKYDAVTYATQATPEFLYHIIEIARFWDGPISVAVFVPSYDLDITMQMMVHLCHCFPGMAKVSLHLFYPKKYPPKMRSRDQIVIATETPVTMPNITFEELTRRKLDNYRNLNNKTRAEYIRLARVRKIEKMMTRYKKGSDFPNLFFSDCSGLDSSEIPTFRRESHMVYAINVGRNIARNASTTNYFLLSDIEMVPSDGLAPKFLTMVRKLMGDEGGAFVKTVFVVPLFEVEKGEEIPRDKDTLVRMVAANRAMYFHQKLCSHCQRFPGLQTWLTRPSPEGLEPMLIARREYPYHRWEPLYFGTNQEPWYTESLSWEGRQDKMPQMLEMCLQGYRMVVLDGGFLCHAAVYKSTKHHARAERINKERFAKIVGVFKKKYPNRPKCIAKWG